jgi:hypothetical protein
MPLARHKLLLVSTPSGHFDQLLSPFTMLLKQLQNVRGSFSVLFPWLLLVAITNCPTIAGAADPRIAVEIGLLDAPPQFSLCGVVT